MDADAFTAEILGTERAGNGVLIRDDGLVLTIGYLITEAEEVWLTTNTGRVVPGHVLAYDQVTGFGLVQALARLDIPVLPIGDSSRAPVGEHVVVAGAGGRCWRSMAWAMPPTGRSASFPRAWRSRCRSWGHWCTNRGW